MPLLALKIETKMKIDIFAPGGDPSPLSIMYIFIQ